MTEQTSTGRGRGRPPLPAGEVERVFLGAGLTRRDLVRELGYTSNYIGALMRGEVAMNARFVGLVALRWPEVAAVLSATINRQQAAFAAELGEGRKQWLNRHTQ